MSSALTIHPVRWLADQPEVTSARILVTVLEEKPPAPKRRTFPTAIAGRIQILGDIVSPIVDEEDWDCLKDDGECLK